jgi:hypothetical protein
MPIERVCVRERQRERRQRDEREREGERHTTKTRERERERETTKRQEREELRFVISCEAVGCSRGEGGGAGSASPPRRLQVWFVTN